MLLSYHAARESSKGAGVGLSTKEGIQPFVWTVICPFSAYCYCSLFLGFHATFVSESMKEKTVRETEIQTIQRKVRTLKTVCHGSHFKRIHVVFWLQNVFVYLFLYFLAAGQAGERSRYSSSPEEGKAVEKTRVSNKTACFNDLAWCFGNR